MQANTAMAENNNNRKSKRNFSLEKPVERRFDIEKEVETASVVPIKPNQVKYGTSTQQEQEVTPQKTATKPQGKNVPSSTPTGGSNGGNNSMKWIIYTIIVAALVACAYIFISGNKSDKKTDPQPPEIEQNDKTQNGNSATDSIANAENENEEGVAGEDNNAADEDAGTSLDESNNPNEPVSQPSTSSNDNQSAGNSSVIQGISSTPALNSASNSSIEQKAKDVWKGVYGNNPDRRKNLGSDYEAVQKLVNEMHSQGLN